MLAQFKQVIIQMKAMLESETQQKAMMFEKLQAMQKDKIQIMSERDHAINKLLIYLNKD